MDRQVTAVVVGCGQRGRVYSSWALDYPDQLRIVALVDPSESRLAVMKARFPSAEPILGGWDRLVGRGRLADIAIVATPDRDHADAAVAVARLGYHCLLEKPMAVTEEDCRRICRAFQESGTMLAVCHVLRYTPANRKIKELLDGGAIGDLVNIEHLEPVGWAHFAHSYVRGNWRRQDESTFSLLAKSCHDIDLLRYWAGGSSSSSSAGGVVAERVASFGSLRHFRRENKPAEAGGALRCLDCPLQDSCPYSAKTIYVDAVRREGPEARFVQVLTDEVPDVENITGAVRNGPYGRCVYECDNDVADNQTVNIQFSNGVLASFLMTAFSERTCQRQTRMYGTRGELCCVGDGRTVEVFDFSTRQRTVHTPEDAPENSRLSGHGGADFFLMQAFVRAVARNDPSLIRTGPEDALASHELVFRAERSRLERSSAAPPSCCC